MRSKSYTFKHGTGFLLLAPDAKQSLQLKFRAHVNTTDLGREGAGIQDRDGFKTHLQEGKRKAGKRDLAHQYKAISFSGMFVMSDKKRLHYYRLPLKDF